ncbi:hypothetical protein [Glycomyces sp. NPDC047010]|uniref:hypothetical protein n=1 Tax=Glycomyces sp. NPDC047010 TaxID=3155023 RepID=UPI0033D98968
MPAAPWLIDGPRSKWVLVANPDAPSAAVAPAADRLDAALAGFAEPPPRWLDIVHGLGLRWLLAWAAIGAVLAGSVVEPLVGGVFLGLIGGAFLGGAIEAAMVRFARRRAERRAGRGTDAVIASLASTVRPTGGGIDWAEAVVAAEPQAAAEVHGLMWRMADLGAPDTPDSQEAAERLFELWKRVDPEAAAELELDD